MTETDHNCENCYYQYFDSRAYPCSMCIMGEERKDMWKPKMAKMPKADGSTISKDYLKGADDERG